MNLVSFCALKDRECVMFSVSVYWNTLMSMLLTAPL